MSEIEQLQKFVEWEREHNPDKTHVAEWALTRIRKLEGYRSESEQQFQAKVEDIIELEAKHTALLEKLKKLIAYAQSDDGCGTGCGDHYAELIREATEQEKCDE